MAYEIPILTHSLVSTGNSTSDQYKVCIATSSANADGMKVASSAARGVFPWVGVLQENTTEAGSVALMSQGISKVAAGDSSAMENAIAVGAELMVSSAGQAVPSTEGAHQMLGIALEGLSTGSTGIITVLLTPGAKTST